MLTFIELRTGIAGNSGPPDSRRIFLPRIEDNRGRSWRYSLVRDSVNLFGDVVLWSVNLFSVNVIKL